MSTELSKRDDRGRAETILLGGVVVVALALFLNRRTEFDEMEEVLPNPTEAIDRVRALDPSGEFIDLDEVRAMTAPCRPEREPPCGEPFTLVDGCCALKESDGNDSNFEQLVEGFAPDIALEVGMTIAETFVGREMAKRAARKASEKAARKAAQEVLERAGGEVTEEVLEQAAKAAGEAAEQVLKKAKKGVSKTLATKLTNKATDLGLTRAMNKLGSKAVVSKLNTKAIQEAMQAVGTTIANKASSSVLAKTLSKKIATATSSRLTRTVVTRLISNKILKNVIRVVSRKLAQFSSRIASKITSSPFGWAMGVFDLVSLALDLADPEGYNNFVSNREVEKARNVSEMAQREQVMNHGGDWPPFVTLDTIGFDGELTFATYYATAMNQLIDKYIMGEAIALLSPDVYEVMADQMENGVELNDLPDEINVALEKSFADAMGQNTKRRDKRFLALLQAEMPENMRELVDVYPSRSTPTRIAVSLSERGVEWWNQKHRADWIRYNDMFANLSPPDDYHPPELILFTDKYRELNELNPGTADSPNVVQKRLSQRQPVSLPIGFLVSFCEKVKNVPKINGKVEGNGVDPYQYGVRFNYDLGVCTYTRDWCKRMGGLEYRGPKHGGRTLDDPFITDCHLSGGHAAAQMVVGTTITNNIARSNARGDSKIRFSGSTERRSVPKTRKCERGETCSRDAHCKDGRKCTRGLCTGT